MGSQFAQDLVLPASSRGEHDIEHQLRAVASSSDAGRARTFAEKFSEKAGGEIASYGSFGELVNDSNVDIVYIASPTSEHYRNILLCLEAGKHVLCEVSLSVYFVRFVIFVC